MTPFTPRDWRDLPDHSTPITAAALEDLETRVTDYADTLPLGATYNNTFGDITVEAGAMGGIYPVTDFGAVGDGGNDDTVGVQAAIDLARANGGIAYFPPGTYKITSTLSLSQNNNGFRLMGVGRPDWDSASAATLHYTGTGQMLQLYSTWGVEIDHLRFTYTTGFLGDLIDLDGDPNNADNQNFHIHHCASAVAAAGARTARSIIRVDKSVIGQIDHCHLTGTANSAIRLGETDSYVVSVTISDSTFNSNDEAHIILNSGDGENLVIERCTFEAGSNTPGIEQIGGLLRSPIIANNWFGDADPDVTTVWVHGLTTMAGAPGIISGNRMYEVGAAGSYFQDFDGPFVLIGNNFDGGGGGTDAVFDNCEFATLTLMGNAEGNVSTWFANGTPTYKALGNNTLPDTVGGSVLNVRGSSGALDVTGPGSVLLGTHSYALTPPALGDRTAIYNEGIDSHSQVHHADTVKLRHGSAGSAVDRTQFTEQGIDLLERAGGDADSPAANTGRLFTKDNGAGKTQLCVKFASGVTQVIATEPA